MNLSDYRLCYATDHLLYFTDGPLGDVSGDDWDDNFYYCNASEPYEWEEYRKVPKYNLLRVYWEGFFTLPSQGSVDDINNCKYPWLQGSKITIYADTPFNNVLHLINKEGGKVFFLLEAQEMINFFKKRNSIIDFLKLGDT